MTALRVPPGASLAQAKERLRGGGLWLPGSVVLRSAPTLTGGAANTPGAWVQVTAALGADVGWLKITPGSTTAASATNSSMLVDIGVGGAGSEVVVIPSIALGYLALGVASHPSWLFPIFIPRGSRVAARCASAAGAVSVDVRVDFFAPTHGLIPSRSVPVYGAVTASSRGTLLTNPTSNGVKSAWTEITAATTEPAGAFGIGIQGGGDTDLPSADVFVDVGVGAAGSETVIAADIYAAMTSAEVLYPVSPLVRSYQIPAGTRIAARWSANPFTGASLDALIHAIRPPA